jgi:RNA polymerase sigma-70 factor (ECF subfamily)
VPRTIDPVEVTIPTPVPTPIELHLAGARDRYLRFVRGKIRDPELAEDVLQDAILNALRADPGIDDDGRLAAWFYRVLRNAVIDAYRRRDTRARHAAALEGFDQAEPTEADSAALCECFRALVPGLKPEYAEVIDALDLKEEPVAAFAARTGITPENLKVRRYRARRALRARLEETCRLCAPHGCLDCQCN